MKGCPEPQHAFGEVSLLAPAGRCSVRKSSRGVEQAQGPQSSKAADADPQEGRQEPAGTRLASGIDGVCGGRDTRHWRPLAQTGQLFRCRPLCGVQPPCVGNVC
jgi:hypothetical protein